METEEIQGTTVLKEAQVKEVNKHIHAWVFNGLLGAIGVDRFVRGQTGLGVLKLITIGGCGAWGMVDFVIALMKAYGSAYKGEEYFTFIDGRYSR